MVEHTQLDTKSLPYLRGYLITCCICYPGFASMMELFIPTVPSFLWWRVYISFPILIIFSLSFLKAFLAKRIQIIANIAAFLFSAHYLWLLFLTQLDFNYVCGSMMILAALTPTFHTYWSLGIYLTSYLSCSILCCILVGKSSIHNFQQICGTVTIGIFAVYALYLRKIADQLQVDESKRQQLEMNQNFARVSHDLKNPILLLTAQLTQVLGEQDPEKLRLKMSELALKHKIRLSLVMDMMKDLRLLSGTEQEKPKQDIDLKSSWEKACERISEIQPLLSFIGFDSSYRGECVTIKMNRTNLDRLLENLIKNAAEAMLSPGKIELKITAISAGRAYIEVRNTASSITPEILSAIRQDVQVSTKERGSGLGLQVVRTLIEQEKGQVDFSFLEGEFVVHFSLPC